MYVMWCKENVERFPAKWLPVTFQIAVITYHIRREGNAIGCVHLSISFLSIF